MSNKHEQKGDELDDDSRSRDIKRGAVRMKQPARTNTDEKKARQNLVNVQLLGNQAQARRSGRAQTSRVRKLEQAYSPSDLEIHQQAHAQQLQQHMDLESDSTAATEEYRHTTTTTTTTTIALGERNEPPTPRVPAHDIEDLLEQDRELELERLRSLQETMEEEKTAFQDMQAELEHEIERVAGTESTETDTAGHGDTADGNSDWYDLPDAYDGGCECDEAQPSLGEDDDYNTAHADYGQQSDGHYNNDEHGDDHDYDDHDDGHYNNDEHDYEHDYDEHGDEHDGDHADEQDSHGAYVEDPDDAENCHADHGGNRDGSAYDY